MSQSVLVTQVERRKQINFKTSASYNMRVYLLGALLLLIVLLSYVSALDNDAWEEFKFKYNKTYTSSAEEQRRMKVFFENLDYIEAHNLKSKARFSQGINPLSDLTTEEINRTRNGFRLKDYKQDPDRASLFFHRLLTEVNSSASQNMTDKAWYDTVLTPAKLDFRRNGIVSRVKDQGPCGSCWAFATTGAVESIIARQGRPILLSEQNLIDCSRPYGNLGCNGGLQDSALRYIRDYGIMSAFEYPYVAKEGPCRFIRQRSLTRVRGSVFVPQGSESILRLALSLTGPIPVAIDAGQRSFHSYASGVYDDGRCEKEPTKLNHAVLLIGYGTDPVGGDYWLVKNSWGKGWGENGYIKIARNKDNLCGVASYAVVPVPY